MAEVRFLGCDNDVFCASVQARAAEFEQASGHKLTVRLLDNDFYYANQLTDYLGGQSPGGCLHVRAGPGVGAARPGVRAPA
jgi:hypothetical protein